MTAGIWYRKDMKMKKDADVVRNLKNAGDLINLFNIYYILIK